MFISQLGPLHILVTERSEGSFRLNPEKVWQYLQSQPLLSSTKQKFHHLMLQQSTAVFEVTSSSSVPFQLHDADAILTKQNPMQYVLSMVVGDCFPLVFFDQKTGIYAMIHVSRKTADLGIILKTLQKLTNQSVLSSSSFRVWIGPGIQKDSYWIPVLPDQLRNPAWQAFIKQEKNQWQVDLAGFIRQELLRIGIAARQITDLAEDTYCQPDRFFSHRRFMEGKDPEDGRMLIAAFYASPK